jgi:asparagine synthase (glutamine-hydrolysing)
MTKAIRHRGPDSNGIFHDGTVCLGFQRLSILDLSDTARQPMHSPDERVSLVFNGEIYNYVELRTQLEALGHRFHSTGDAEVLLHAYLEWGQRCVMRFNGMWSFLIWDGHRRVLVGSRDRFGKKPLFMYRGKHAIIFASEIKAILSSGQYRGEPSWSAAAALLLKSGLDQFRVSRNTFFEGIEQIPAATIFELDESGKYSEQRYWSIVPFAAPPPPDPAEAYFATFEDSVRLRMRSDVPVGVFLSGGLDSTAVACSLARQRVSGGEGIFAFNFHSDEFDESRFIADTVAQTNLTLVRYAPRPTRMWESLQGVLRCQDEPVHSFAPVAVYELSRLAAEHGVKVVLIGGGADEYLAGYVDYFARYWYQLMRGGHPLRAWSEISAFTDAYGTSRAPLVWGTLARLRSELRRLPYYRALSRTRYRRALQANPWYTDDLKRRLPDEQDDFVDPGLDTTLLHAVNHAPLPFYLRMDDRSSMAWSVEARSPFLDYRAVELAFNLPGRWKMRGPLNKFVLREAMRGRVPESVRSRREKWGFPIPAARWFAKDLSGPVAELLADRVTKERGLYEIETISRDLTRHRNGEIDASGGLFDFVQFELWMRIVEKNMGSFSDASASDSRIALNSG